MTPSDTALTRRIVAITSRHAFGERLLQRVREAGIHLEALLVTVQQNTPRSPLKQGVRARAGRLRARVRARWRGWSGFRDIANRVLAFDSLADRRITAALVEARPDVLVLAGTGIVPATLLAVPSLVTLNAHPGLLPWVRGVCPLEHALLRGVALGVTVHGVDAGIDTGPIIRRVLLPVTNADSDRITLSRRLEDAAIDTLVEVTRALVIREEPLLLRPQTSRHAYGGWVSDVQRARAQQLLDEGVARRLYEQWRLAAGGDVLPHEDDALPGPLRSVGTD